MTIESLLALSGGGGEDATGIRMAGKSFHCEASFRE